MFNLIQQTDSEKLYAKANFSKNAVFYKDLLAFYDAYKSLMNVPTSSLPNYCYWNGSYSLEGVCLFMEMYAAELGFESLKLTLPYLKIIYYYIASYSSSGELPARSVFEQEFENYKSNLLSASEKLYAEVQSSEAELGAADKNFKAKSKKNIGGKSASMLFNVLAIVSLLTGIFCVIAPLTFYFLNSLQLVIALVAAGGCLAIGIILFLVFKRLSIMVDSKETGLAYETQRNKIFKNEKYAGYQELVARYNDLRVELYEANCNLSGMIFGEVKLSFDEVLERARQYYALSYNIKRDVFLLLSNQEREIKNVTLSLLKPSKLSDDELANLYGQIEQKDWLYNSLLVRFAYISRFIENAEKSNTWQLHSSEKQTPFGINIKAIAKEPVAFLRTPESLFVSSSIDKILRGKYLNRQEIFKLSYSAEKKEVHSLAQAYVSKFYNYENLKGYNNLFYDKKMKSSAKVPEELIKTQAKIPTLISIRLKLIAMNAGMENSDSKEILSLAETLFAEDAQFAITSENYFKKIDITEKNLVSASYEFDDVSDTGVFSAKYKKGATEFIGYKID